MQSPVIIDVDCFTGFHDATSQEAGDHYLGVVAAAVAEHAMREGHLTACYEGEEFAVTLPHTDHKQALGTGERIRSAVEALPVP